jgi:predicted phage tail protein
MLSKIKLYGKLAKFIGHRVLEADIASAAEAVRFLVVNFPGLEQHMAEQHYRVSVGSYDLSEDELHHPSGQQQISIVPVIAGAGAAARIIAGVALIGLSFGLATIAAGAALAGNLSGFALQAAAGIAQAGLYVGAALALTGVAQLLSPVPTLPTGQDTQSDPRKSYSFSGIQQVSRQGVPLPIAYGETMVGSVVVSQGVDTVQVSG